MEEQKRGRGRPKKDIPYDQQAVEEFVKRFFEIQREANVLKEDTKQLKEEFADRINHKLLGKVIRLVKLKLSLDQENASEQTIEEIEELVKEKVNMVA